MQEITGMLITGRMELQSPVHLDLLYFMVIHIELLGSYMAALLLVVQLHMIHMENLVPHGI